MMNDFNLALNEAELLKLLPHGGVLAREFLRLVDQNKDLVQVLKIAQELVEDKINQNKSYYDVRGYILASLKMLEDIHVE